MKVLIPRHELGGLNQEPSAGNTNVMIMLGWDRHKPISVYGCGNGVDALQQSNTTTGLSNGRAVIPYYWSAAGYAVLAVTANDNQPARWRGATNGEYLTWTFPGPEAGTLSHAGRFAEGCRRSWCPFDRVCPGPAALGVWLSPKPVGLEGPGLY